MPMATIPGSSADLLVGVGQARNRHRLAIARTVPFVLCCYSRSRPGRR